MPEDAYEFLPHREVLRFEELATVARAFAALGVEKLRLTGGEPLLRRDLPELVRLLAVIEPRFELALTTNGVLLAPLASSLRQAGLDRVTVSLDTLDRSRFVA